MRYGHDQMNMWKINGRKFIIRYLICLAALIALAAGYWYLVRSARMARAREDASLTARYIESRIKDMEKLADIPAAWLDAEGDAAKDAIAASEDSTQYKDAFQRLAKALYDADRMAVIELAPAGTVRYAFPREAHESVIGADLVGEIGDGLVREDLSHEMKVIGPSFIDHLGTVLGFCVPVYYEDGSFWGYTVIAMKLPDALEELALERLTEQGYDCALRCKNDSGSMKAEWIGGTSKSTGSMSSVSIDIYGKEWILSVRPVSGWVSIGGIVLSVVVAAALAFLLAWILEKRKEARDEAMGKLRSDAKHDKMTGLLNHTASAEAIDEALQTVEGGVLLLIDVDNFKSVNDTAGHLAGDEVLIEVANAMRTTFRRNDILGRYGGDEFIVYMLGDISIPDFSVKASQFQRKIRKIPIGQTGKYAACSIGGARRCVETPTAEALVKRADEALYTSKGNGKDRFTIYDDSGSTVIVTPKQDENRRDHDFTLAE